MSSSSINVFFSSPIQPSALPLQTLEQMLYTVNKIPALLGKI
jgi:hypothetical protein